MQSFFENEYPACPICGLSSRLMDDNMKLNEHVDFCLSRGQIRKIQKEIECIEDTTARAAKRRKSK